MRPMGTAKPHYIKYPHSDMQAQDNLYSGKDLQLIKLTYRTLIENYYENPNEDSVADVILLNNLTMQAISTKWQSDSILVISLLEILKVKAKGHRELMESVQETIIHLKNPMKIYFKDSTIQESLDRITLFPLCCTLVCRTFETELKPHVNDYNWKDILTKIGKHADKNMVISLETLAVVLPSFQQLAKDVNKSGLIKILCSVYLLQALDDKNNLYKALKVLKIVSTHDRTVLLNREKNISTVIYTHPQYIPIVREISENCYDSDYCPKIIANVKDTDPLFLWSYNSAFCQLSSQATISELEQILQKQGSGIAVDLEFKIYSIINNLMKNQKQQKLRASETWKIPVHAQQNMNAYLKLAISEIEADPNSFKKVDIKKLEAVYQKFKITDPITDKLLGELRNLDPDSRNRRVGQLKSSSLQAYEMDKNPEMLMEKAMKIPQNQDDTLFTKEILAQKPHKSDQFQQDTLYTIRSKALESLKTAIAEAKPINLGEIFNSLNLNTITPRELNKLYKMAELSLTMNPDHAKQFDQKKLLEITQWLEDNHGNQVIDWVAVGQVIQYVFGGDEWKNHINKIPNQAFWLLNAYDCEITNDLMKKLKSLDVNHPKIPLIVGFIGKAGDQKLKKLLLDSAIVNQVVSNIKNYNSDQHPGVKPYMSITTADFPTEALEMNKYLNNVLNASHLIYNWDKSDIKADIENKIIKPVLPNIYKSFLGTEAEFRFLENSLPIKLNLEALKDMNVARLLEKHGNLSAYLYKNKYEGKIDMSKIANLSQLLRENQAIQLEEILRFLENNEGMLDAHELNKLLTHMIKNAKRDHKYWKLFPNYMSLLNHLISIASKSADPEVIAKLSDLLSLVITGTIDNDDISNEELDQLHGNIHGILKQLIQRNIKLDTNRLRTDVNKIANIELRNKLLEELKKMDGLKVVESHIKIEAPPLKSGNKISLEADTSTIQVHQKNEYKSVAANLAPSTIAAPDPQKKGEAFEAEDEKVHADDMEKMMDKLGSKELVGALQMLKKIIKKEEPKEKFPPLIDVFMGSEISRMAKFILGELLTQYYEIIERDERVLNLLQLREKTNLSRSICLAFLTKFEEAFVLAKRWKLLGKEFIDLAMVRMQSKNPKMKAFCVENSCEVAEYNLLQNEDLNYFESAKYHHQVIKNLERITESEEAIYYLLLVGTSARLLPVKTAYIENKLHSRLLNFVNNPGWTELKHFVANLSYALSSLVYTQNHISVEVVSRKAQMLRLFESYRNVFFQTKIVVESGCSLISNLCYSNKECKEILFGYEVHSILCKFMVSNLEKPEVPTYKQIMRALGNLSLYKPCVEKLVDSKINLAIIDMISRFDILFYRDEERMKVLKLTIDFLSNMAAQKYKLETIHSEGITDLTITLIETTQISDNHIIMGCIDTIDGLSQNETVENYCVMDKKLPYLLIDLLKIKEDERLITKCIRLLTNMTLNETCTPYILEANLLSVLANIVLPMYHNPKIEAYINKIIQRIFLKKPPVKQIIKCGYLDCLLKTVDNSPAAVDDSFIDIMLHYSQHFPGYLVNRAFLSLVKFMTIKQGNKMCVEKTFKVLKIMFSSEEKEDEDMDIQGAVGMYEKLFASMEGYRNDIVYLISLHCMKSRKFKSRLIHDHQQKKTQLINNIHSLTLVEQTRELGLAAMFAVLNHERTLLPIGNTLEVGRAEEEALKLLKKGCKCKLFRADGSSKQAVIDINDEFMIKAYKSPDGEIKKKYMMSIRQIRDWQFVFSPNDDVWRQSVFAKQKGLFEGDCIPKNCVALLGGRQWGEFSFICLEFERQEEKMQFMSALSILLMSFRR